MSIALLTALSTPLVAGATYLSPAVYRFHAVHRLQNYCQRNRALVLTFDDGPSIGTTSAVLDLLHRNNHKATFFPVGFRAKTCPEVLDRMQSEGHEIGCHTHQHTNAWKVFPWRAISDMRMGYDTLSNWVKPDGLFRPPYGKITLATAMAAHHRGSKVGWWTHDSHDTHRQLPAVQSVIDRVYKDHGGVVLLHDFDRKLERKNFVLEVVSGLLELVDDESLYLRKLGDVLAEISSDPAE